MPRLPGFAISVRKCGVLLLSASLLPTSSPALSPLRSEPMPGSVHATRSLIVVVTAFRVGEGFSAHVKRDGPPAFGRNRQGQTSSEQAAPTAAGQQITLAENGSPIAGADVALVLANMNKVSLGQTDAQGKTAPPPENTNTSPGNEALNLANLGKVELHAEVDECANGKKQVYLVGPGGQLPAPQKDCKRHQLTGTFFWGQLTDVVLDLGLGTLRTGGAPLAPRPAQAQNKVGQGGKAPGGTQTGTQPKQPGQVAQGGKGQEENRTGTQPTQPGQAGQGTATTPNGNVTGAISTGAEQVRTAALKAGATPAEANELAERFTSSATTGVTAATTKGSATLGNWSTDPESFADHVANDVGFKWAIRPAEEQHGFMDAKKKAAADARSNAIASAATDAAHSAGKKIEEAYAAQPPAKQAVANQAAPANAVTQQQLTSALNTHFKKVQDAYRKKASQLEGSKTVNGVAYDTDTIARMVATRDVYVQQLQTLVNLLNGLEGWRKDQRIALLQRTLRAKLWGDLLEYRRYPSTDSLTVTGYHTYFQRIADRLESMGDKTRAAIVRRAEELPLPDAEKLLAQQLTNAIGGDPLVGGLYSHLNGDPLDDPSAFLVGLDLAIPEVKKGAQEEIQRANQITTVEGMSEFFKPQYANARLFAANMFGGLKEVRNFEEFAQLYQQNAQAEGEVTKLTFAIVVSGLAVVAIVAAPVVGGIASLSGASEAGVATATGVTTAVGSGVNLGAMGVQLVWDGKELVAVQSDVSHAEKGQVVIGQQAIAQLKREREGAIEQGAVDVIFATVSAADFKAAVDAAREANAARAAAAAKTANAAATGTTSATGLSATGERLVVQAERGAAKAKQLGLDPQKVDEMLAEARDVPGGPVGVRGRTPQARDLPVLQAERAIEEGSKLAGIGSIDQLTEQARAAGVPESMIQDIVNPSRLNGLDFDAAVVAAGQFIPNQLRLATGLQKGAVIVIDRTPTAQRALAELFGGLPESLANSLRGRVLTTDLLRFEDIKLNLAFMRAGRPVVWNAEDFAALQTFLGRSDARNLYGFIEGPSGAIEGGLERVLTDEEIQAGQQLLQAQNLQDILQGRAVATAIVDPSLLPFVPPTFLVDQSGHLISAEAAAKLTSAEIRQLSAEFVQNGIGNPALKSTLQQRMKQEALKILAQGGTPSEVVWAQRVVADSEAAFAPAASTAGVVDGIAASFGSSSYNRVLLSESIGGNAGPGHAAVNAVVDRQTGRIIQFGNPQDLNPAILPANNPQNVMVSFRVRAHIGQTEVPPTIDSFLPGDGLSEVGRKNIEEAIGKYNDSLRASATGTKPGTPNASSSTAAGVTPAAGAIANATNNDTGKAGTGGANAVQPNATTGNAVNATGAWIPLGRDTRPGDFNSLDSAVKKYLIGQKQKAYTWKPTRNPDGSVTYVSADGQNSLVAKSENGQIVVLQRTRVDTGGALSGSDQAVYTYLWDHRVRWGAYLWKVTNPDGSTTYTIPNGKTSINVTNTGNPSQPYTFQDVTTSMSASATTPNTGAKATNQPGANATNATGGSKTDTNKVDTTKVDGSKTDTGGGKSAGTNTGATSGSTPTNTTNRGGTDTNSNVGGNANNANNAGATKGSTGTNTGTTGNVVATNAANTGANTTGTNIGTNNSKTGGTSTGGNGTGTNNATGTNVATGGQSGTNAGKTCKDSDDDCAELGIIARQKQVEAVQARDVANHVPDMRSHLSVLDSAASTYQTVGNSAAASGDMAGAAAYRQKAAAANAEAAALSKQINSAEAEAAAAEKAAEDAWKAYFDCTRLPLCPRPSNTTGAGANAIGGLAGLAPVNASGESGGSTASFSNCPKAKDQMDQANSWRRQAAVDAGKMQQALATGDTQAAQYLQNSVAQDLSFAKMHDQLAAEALKECNDHLTAQVGGGAPATGGNPGGTTNPSAGNNANTSGGNSIGGASGGTKTTPDTKNTGGGTTGGNANGGTTVPGNSSGTPAADCNCNEAQLLDAFHNAQDAENAAQKALENAQERANNDQAAMEAATQALQNPAAGSNPAALEASYNIAKANDAASQSALRTAMANYTSAQEATVKAEHAYDDCVNAKKNCPPPSNSTTGTGNSSIGNNSTGKVETSTGGTTAVAASGGEVAMLPPEGPSSACVSGSSTCSSASECITDLSCANIKEDICKTSPGACSTNTSGDSPYQLMMTASSLAARSARLQKQSRLIPASYRSRAKLRGLPEEILRAELPASQEKAQSLDVALVATGNASGEAFQLQVRDGSGKTKRVGMPEGVVLEPTRSGSAKPPAAQGVSGLLTQQIGGFCMQFMKLPPPIGMVYKIAGPALQQKYQPMRLVLQAGRALAEKGKLHPDSDPQAYADSIRQYSVWAKQEGWDEKKFGDNFVERTRKNAEVKNVKWTQQIENALRNAVPGRWRDITQVLNLAGAWEKGSPRQAKASD